MTEAIGGVLIGGLLAIAGGFAQAWWAGRAVDRQLDHADRTRSRSIRLDAYAAFLTAERELHDALGAPTRELEGKFQAFRLIYDRAMLVAPNETAHALTRVIASVERCIDEPTDEAALDTLEKAESAFLIVARHDVGTDRTRLEYVRRVDATSAFEPVAGEPPKSRELRE